MSRKIKETINRKLYKLTYNTYFDSIPLDTIGTILGESGLRMVDIDGTDWSGFLLGANSRASFYLYDTDNKDSHIYLFMSWYKMPSGHYEIVVYVS